MGGGGAGGKCSPAKVWKARQGCKEGRFITERWGIESVFQVVK